MMESAKYTTLKTADSVILYLDEYERKDILGQSRYGMCDWMLQIFVVLVWIISLPLTWYFSFKVIPQFERVVVFRLGRVRSLKGPGLVSVIPFVDSWKRVDMRMRAFKVPPQEVLTLDHALVKLGADVQYRISDPITTYTLIQDIDHCLRVTGQSVLTSQLCLNDLSGIQNHKVSLQQSLQLHMNKTVGEWGIEIARFELSSYIILKNPGGLEPISNDGQDDCGGGAAIMEVIKSFTSGSSSVQIPGMMPTKLPSIPAQTMTKAPASQVQAMLTPSDLFAVAKGVIDEQLCLQVKSIFEIHVADDLSTEVWCLDLKNSPGFVIKEACMKGTVDVKLSLNREDFQKMFYGILNPTDAYMSGSLKVDGSIQTAQKLEHLVKKMQCLST